MSTKKTSEKCDKESTKICQQKIKTTTPPSHVFSASCGCSQT